MMFYPRRKPSTDICDPVDCRAMCAQRRMAVVAGAFGYDERREGYYCTEITGPWEIPVMLDGCPYCGGLLPGKQQRRAFEDLLRRQDEAKAQKLLPPPYSGPVQNGGSDATAWSDDDGN